MISTTKLSLGDISVNFARVILETLEGLGYASRPLANNFKLTTSFLETPEARISIPRYMRLGHQAISISGRPDIGVLIGEKTSTTDLGVAGLTAISAETLAMGLNVLIDYQLLSSYNSRGMSRYQEEAGRAACVFYSISPYNAYNCFVVDGMLSAWWKFIRTNTDGRPECHHLEIEYQKPSYASRLEEHFGCPIIFGASRNALVLKRGHHTLPLKERCAATYKQMRGICEQQLQSITSDRRLSNQVTELITQNLVGETPDIDSIAQQLGMAGWTLRRRLADEGATYKDMLDKTRKALAHTYVKDTQHNFTEIAFLLGFSSPAAFQRAFKRWTNMSPGDMRRDQTKKK